MLGLGAGIDYALLLAARQQEELRAGHAPLEAARRANATAGHSALTAAGIVLVSISGLLVTGIPFVGRAGVAAGPRRARLRRHVRGPAARALRPRRPSAAAAPRARRGAARRRRAGRAPWATRRPWLALRAAGAVTPRSPRPRPAWSSASPTTATSARTRPSARPTTGSPRASAPASTGRWSSPSRCPTAGASPALRALERGIAADRDVAAVARAGRSTRPATPP